MTLESLTTTLETSKKLKAAGFPQKSTHFIWFPYFDNPLTESSGANWELSTHDGGSIVEGENIAAPTAAEIADQLPGSIPNQGHPHSENWLGVRLAGPNGWIASYYNAGAGTMGPSGPFSPGKTIAESLAALWLKLEEKK